MKHLHMLILCVFLVSLPSTQIFGQYIWPYDGDCKPYDYTGPEIYMDFKNFDDFISDVINTDGVWVPYGIRVKMQAQGPVWVNFNADIDTLSIVPTSDPNWSNYAEAFFPPNATDENIDGWIRTNNPCNDDLTHWWGFAGPGLVPVWNLSSMMFAIHKVSVDLLYNWDDENFVQEVGAFYLDSRDLALFLADDIWININLPETVEWTQQNNFTFSELTWQYSTGKQYEPYIYIYNDEVTNPFDWAIAKGLLPYSDKVTEFAPYLISIKSKSKHPLLSWEHYSDYSFCIYRSTSSSGTFQLIGTTGPGVFNYYDKSITTGSGPDKVYYYVKAQKDNVLSKPSNIKSIYVASNSIESKPISLADNQKLNLGTYNLNSAFPNPFNPTTKIKYELAEDSKVEIKVLDVLGKEVAELVNEDKSAGLYEVEFNASSLASGIYFYRMQAGSFVDTKKMILMK